MNNKTILTSIIALGFVCPAMAVNVSLFEKNQTYSQAATKTNIDVYSGQATAKAYYDIKPGYYLPANTYIAASCPANSYCPGTSNVTQSTSAKGIFSCPSPYSYSDSGADSKVDCYELACDSINRSNVSSGTTWTGHIYFGELDNCVPGACNSGYSVLNVPVNSTYGSMTSGIYGTCIGGTCSGTIDSGFDMQSGDTWGVYFSGVNGRLIGSSKCAGVDSQFVFGTVAEATQYTGGRCVCWLTGYMPGGAINRRRELKSLAVLMPSIADGSCTEANCATACAAAATTPGLTSADAKAAKLMFEHASNTEKCVNAEYTITYTCGTASGVSGNGGTEVVEYGLGYVPWSSANTDCSRTGYNLTSWSVSGGGSVNAGATGLTYPYASNKTYTAAWTAKTSTVTLKNNTTTVDTVTATYDSAMPVKNTSNASLTMPTQSGKVFTGYYDSSSTPVKYYNSNLTSAKTWNKTGSQTLNAQFESCSCTTVSGVATCNLKSTNGVTNNTCNYDVTYNSGKYGPATQTGTAGVGAYTATVSSCSNKPASNASYTGSATSNACPWQCSTGYSTTGKQNGATTGTESGKTCSAINDYTITYTWNDGSCSNPASTYTYGVGTTLCTPTRSGYTFTGWTGSNGNTAQTSVTIGNTATGNKAYIANWSANGYTITYKAGQGGSGADQTQNVTFDSSFTTKASNTFSKDHATFAGWSSSGESYPSAATEYTYNNVGSITLTATWNCNAGYTLNSTTGACDPCAAGKFKGSAGNGACTSASNGYFACGSAGSCTGATSQTKCVQGSYSAAASGSSTCTACPGGRTTSGSGTSYNATPNTACSQECASITNLKTWKSATWNTNNTMSNLCKVDTCNTAVTGTGAKTATYTITNNACVYSGTCSDGYNTPTASGYTINCTANTISILWHGIASSSVKLADGTSMTDFSSTNYTAKSSVSYDGAVSTPVSGREPTGMTFKGWKFK